MKYSKLWLVSMLVSLSLLTGCGQTGSKPAAKEEMMGEKAETAPKVTSAPISMKKTEQTTPSGMKVERKTAKYKVIIGANVRADSDGSSEWVGSLFVGDIVQGTGVCENGWIEVRFDGRKGYVTPGCLEETQEGEVNAGNGTVTPTATPTATSVPKPAETQSQETPSAETTEPAPSPEVTINVTDWAKFTSSKWEYNGDVSCYVQIHSVAGNVVIFKFRVVDGKLDGGGVSAEVNNCRGKIENGIMNFTFTDDQGNSGVGRMEIADKEQKHLRITTMVDQPHPEAAFKAEIMATLDEVN